MISIADTLAAVQPHLAPELAAPHARAALHSVLTRIPAALSNWVYLECRLAPTEEQVDLILRVDDRGREILDGSNPVVALPSDLRDAPAWSRVRTVAALGAQSDPRRHGGAGMLWLEFDLDSATAAAADPPEPGILLGLPSRPGGSADPGAADPLAPLAPFLGADARAVIGRTLARCRAALPPDAFLAYLGCFPHRPGSPLRICVAGLGHRSMAGYLHRVGWDGTVDEVQACLAEIHRSRRSAWAPEPTLLHLDIADGLGPRIGLEYVCAHRPQLRNGVAETSFLAHLDALGLCTPAKRAALLAWPGYSVERLPHELWRSLLVRRLNHVKLVLGPDAEPQAKAYLSFHHLPWPRH